MSSSWGRGRSPPRFRDRANAEMSSNMARSSIWARVGILLSVIGAGIVYSCFHATPHTSHKPGSRRAASDVGRFGRRSIHCWMHALCATVSMPFSLQSHGQHPSSSGPISSKHTRQVPSITQVWVWILPTPWFPSRRFCYGRTVTADRSFSFAGCARNNKRNTTTAPLSR